MKYIEATCLQLRKKILFALFMSVRVFFISLDHGLSALLWYDDAYQLTNRSCPIKRQKINPGSFEHLPNHTGKCAIMREKIKQAPAQM